MARDGCGTTTVLRAHGVLSGIMADAVKARRTRPRASKTFHARLRVDTYTCRPAMFSAGGRGGRTRRLGADAGVRRPAVGEAIPLRVRDVEFLKSRMMVHQNTVQLGVDHAVGPTKGRNARSVPVPSFVLDELAKHCKGKAADALVFSGRDGRYLPRPKSRDGWFTGSVKRAGVQQITPHDLRRRCASLAVSVGVNVLALQRMLGHKSPR
jgi:integrase